MSNKVNNSNFSEIPVLLKKYVQDTCTKAEAIEILDVLEDSANDEILKEEVKSVWEFEVSEEQDQLNQTENRLTMDRILDRLHHRIRLHEDESIKGNARRSLIGFFSKVAAILILPLLIYSIILTVGSFKRQASADSTITWQTVKTIAGMQTDFQLPDGSHVWMNSSSELKYPVPFESDKRQVELTGEAFFDVTKDVLHPFLVRAGKMNIEVKGTRFNVINYPNEAVTELILESGSVRLYSGNYTDQQTISYVKPGEKATLDLTQNKLSIEKVEIEKYMAWKNGELIFRDDKMDEVVRKLNRWYNVEIVLQSPELKEYVYTATYRDETLPQILELLKISAPVQYEVTERMRLLHNSFSKKKILITKRK